MSTMLLSLILLAGASDGANAVPRSAVRAHSEVSARIISGEAVRAQVEDEFWHPKITSSGRPYMELPIAQFRTKVAGDSSNTEDKMLVEFY